MRRNMSSMACKASLSRTPCRPSTDDCRASIGRLTPGLGRPCHAPNGPFSGREWPIWASTLGAVGAGFEPSWPILNFTHFQVTCRNGSRGVRSSRSPNPMHPPEEFLRHAAECKLTAKLARDPASKAAWSQMAKRWLQCAELAERKSLTARYATPVGRFRRPSPAWRHL